MKERWRVRELYQRIEIEMREMGDGENVLPKKEEESKSGAQGV